MKHVHDLSDEEIVARWVENPYWQYFCCFEFFQHDDALAQTNRRGDNGQFRPQRMPKAVQHAA